MLKTDRLLIYIIALSFLQFSFFPLGRYFLTLQCYFVGFTMLFFSCGFKRGDLFWLVGFIILMVLASHSAEDFNELFLANLKLIFAFMALYLGKNLIINTDESKYVLFKLVNFVVIITIAIDLFFRLKWVGYNISQVFNNFYLLKFGSVMFSDSNGVGMYACVCIAINMLLYKFVPKKLWYVCQLTLFFLVIFTLSRSAITSAAVGFLVFFFYRLSLSIKEEQRHISILIIVLFILFSSIFVIPEILQDIIKDGSGSTKVKIFMSIPELMGADLFSDIFGRGLTVGGKYFSFDSNVKYAHAALPLLLGFFGILGLLIYFVMITIPFRVNRDYAPVFIIFFLMGLSYLEVLFEGLFFLLGLSINSYISKVDEG